MKDRIELNHVVLIGRTFEEYCRYFQLQHSDLESNRILDVGSGVSSFCAESGSRGYDVTAADPIYDQPVETIAATSAKDLKTVMQKVPAAAHKYNWTFYRDVNELARYRTAARYRFLEDYSARRDRYVPTALPKTAFGGSEFDIALASHLLFLYDDLLDYEFHKRSILELSRIVRHEIRIYPLANMSGVKSPFLEQLLSDPDCSGLSFTILKSDFEFFKNANEMLKITV
jgi:hypothetical protein